MIHYENIFISRSLPDNLKFWQACASGVVKQLREKNAPESYIAEAEQWKTKIDEFDPDYDDVEKYAGTVLEGTSIVEKYISDDETPTEVAEVYRLFDKTILSHKANKCFSEHVKDDIQDAISRALGRISSMEYDLNALQDDLNDANGWLV